MGNRNTKMEINLWQRLWQRILKVMRSTEKGKGKGKEISINKNSYISAFRLLGCQWIQLCPH